MYSNSNAWNNAGMTAQFIIMTPDLQTRSSEVLPSETFSTQQNLLFSNIQVMLSAYVPSRQHSVLFVQDIFCFDFQF